MMPAEHIDEEVIQVVTCSSLPQCQQRTNLVQNQTSPTFGLVLGGFTQRGHGVTQATSQRALLLEAVHTLARSGPRIMQMPYLAAAITRGPVSIHTDRNYGISMTMALGDFTGGRLVISDVEYANRQRGSPSMLCSRTGKSTHCGIQGRWSTAANQLRLCPQTLQEFRIACISTKFNYVHSRDGHS
eukprot:5260174-Amphidinium_carterae.2